MLSYYKLSKIELERWSSIIERRFLFEREYSDIFLGVKLENNKIIVLMNEHNINFENILEEMLFDIDYEIRICEEIDMGDIYG